MSEDEARKLKPGDKIEAIVSGEYRDAIVIEVREVHDGWVMVYDSSGRGRWARSRHPRIVIDCRRAGLARNGREFPELEKQLSEVQPLGTTSTKVIEENIEPNVFADWLEEQGHDEAAKALRKRFPISKRQ